MRDRLRRYLQGRISLGDPDPIFPRLGRRRARELARRLAEGAGVGRSAVGGGADGDVEAGSRKAGAGEPGPADVAAERPRPGDAGAPGAVLPPEERDRLSRHATREEILRLPDHRALRAVAEACVRCPLHEGRRQVVFGEGDTDARVLCVGEAPGAREDATGRPFVGRAGKLLDRLLLSAGFRRPEVYICNVLKCRPPRNRDPRAEEIESCSPYLLRQIEVVAPEVIIAFGTFASRTLLEVRSSLGRLRGRTHRFHGVPLIVTYHPAALLRNPNWTRPTWEDLQRVRSVLEDGPERAPARQMGLMTDG